MRLKPAAHRRLVKTPDIEVEIYNAYTFGCRNDAAYNAKLIEATNRDSLSNSTLTRKGETKGPRAKNMLKSMRVVYPNPDPNPASTCVD